MKIPEPRKLSSGKYFIQLRLGGESYPITALTAKECKNQAALVKAEFRAGKRLASPILSMTLAEAITKYAKSCEGRTSPTTPPSYLKIRDNSFPDLMSLPLSKIDNNVLANAVDEECLRLSPRTHRRYSPKTIVNSYNLVVSVLHRYAPHIKTDVPLPEIKQIPVYILQPAEIFEVVKGTSVELPVLLSMWLSLSMSEIRGLTKSKSLHNGKLTVLETVVDINGEAVRKIGGKEERRTRTLDVPEYLIERINQVDGDIIVPLSAQTITKRFYRLLDQAGKPHIKFHALRHINASVMAMLNIPDVIANERGGWKTDYTRKKVYTHTFSAQRKDADIAIDNYFNGIVTQYEEHES